MRMRFRNRRGQGMTEYIIIVALIAIAAITVISLFGDNIRALFATTDNALAGNEATPTDTHEATGGHYDHRSLETFAQGGEGGEGGPAGGGKI